MSRLPAWRFRARRGLCGKLTGCCAREEADDFLDDRFGSISTELGGSRHVRFPTDSDRIADIPDWQLRAINRCEQSQHSGLGPWSANIGERAYLARPLAALNQEQGARIADARVLTRHGECERALTLALGSIAA
jgi:hypothetical protein